MLFPKIKINDFEVVNHGIDHSDYFQGCGVSFSNYSHVVTGCGQNFAEAIEDALDQISQQPENFDAEELVSRILKDMNKNHFPRRPQVKQSNYDHYYYVSIRWN